MRNSEELYDRNIFRSDEKGIGSLGIRLSEHQMDQFFTYYEMLVEKNKVMNLTAITEEHEVVTKHFSDSLSLFAVIQEMEKTGKQGVGWFENSRIIDVGTGAGFPGIPLKIVFPGIRVTLLDSLNKRIKFLEEVCDALNLENVTFVHGRAEDAGRLAEHRETYDLCVSRAVANLASLSEYCMPFVKVGGYFVLLISPGRLTRSWFRRKERLDCWEESKRWLKSFCFQAQMLPDPLW